ncbi:MULTISPECIES: thioredoxin family protein [unclassified Leeuwenhoekiella]|uniref:thioredoxin family protein n=1 Tax=unclassified Leeuwenhoekiella TaxID=2615029 RepID=UPI000C3D9995|nr:MULTISPECIES: thioredoxin family protein [unclassified Leeuwenhoekiella]MAU70454.1 thioredoxin family protein [Pseudozobellia sp.]MAW97105.1 thioredoxin family protein [Leeuwenhoekiella sp.]MBA82621.1 thioredoxin family protein [Leeuwenhoekiella sp.]|tara:strand:- start:618 stop:1238 length:621 start_codon:yes stop_codon:yes gene_type:complete
MKSLKILVVLTLLLVVSAFAITQIDTFESGYEVGDVATDFSLKNVNGTLVSLADFEEAKGFILVFTCNTCPFAIANEDRIIALDKQFKSKGYPVIAINPNNPEVQPGDSYEAMQERAREKGFTFPYLFDENQEIYPQYGATKTPHVYILQKEGASLMVRYIGAIDDSARDEATVTKRFVVDAVEALLAGKPVEPSNTKAIGCSIKA